jgi:hypothetical protein
MAWILKAWPTGSFSSLSHLYRATPLVYLIQKVTYPYEKYTI